jgi:hypothetical protein
MFILPLVVTCSTLTPPAEISAIHFTVRYQYAIPASTEIPHPEHDYLEGHLWVNSVTGGPNELRPVTQVSFTVQPPSPFHMPDFAPGFKDGRKAQPRALGARHYAPHKMRGR